jgi:hypothetical protein
LTICIGRFLYSKTLFPKLVDSNQSWVVYFLIAHTQISGSMSYPMPANYRPSSCRLPSYRISLSTRQIVDPPNCPPAKLLTRQIVNPPKCQLAKLSTCQIVNLPNCQPAKLLTRQIIRQSYRNDIQPNFGRPGAGGRQT